MYKYLFLITATLFLSSCSNDSAIEDSDSKDSTLSTTTTKANPPYKLEPKTTAEEMLSNYEVMTIRDSYPTLESAITGYKDEGVMTRELSEAKAGAYPNLVKNLIVWDALVGMNWDELQSLPKTSYPRIIKDIIGEAGKVFCFNGTVHHIQVNRTITPPITDVLMFVPYGGYVVITAVKSSGDILSGEQANFCGIVGGKRYARDGDSIPLLVGMFDLPENK